MSQFERNLRNAVADFRAERGYSSQSASKPFAGSNISKEVSSLFREAKYKGRR